MLRWYTCMNVNGKHVDVWCVPSAARVPCIQRSDNKILGNSVCYLVVWKYFLHAASHTTTITQSVFRSWQSLSYLNFCITHHPFTLQGFVNSQTVKPFLLLLRYIFRFKDHPEGHGKHCVFQVRHFNNLNRQHFYVNKSHAFYGHKCPIHMFPTALVTVRLNPLKPSGYYMYHQV
jgi:hypothetical protein